MMVVCHQPYSELDLIPFSKGLKYMQMAGDVLNKFVGGVKPADNKNSIIPDVVDPREYFK